MNLLNVANEINQEFAAIRARNALILSEQRRAEIFNSIVACLTDGLVDIIKLSIVGRKREFLSWHYDLRRETNIQRSGPSLQEIIATADRVSEEACLTCQVQWSKTFEAMDSETREHTLRDTIWDKQHDTQNPQPEVSRDHHQHSLQASIDLAVLEFDLRNLESYTGLISHRMIAPIIESVRRSVSSGFIVGIQMILSHPNDEEPAIEWGFEFGPDSDIIRQGPSIERILHTAKPITKKTKFEIKPILSPTFETLPPGDKESAMKGTIWEAHFQDWKKGSWWSR